MSVDSSRAPARAVSSGVAAERGRFLGHQWHDLDLEARALAAWGGSGPSAPTGLEAAPQASHLIAPLIERDKAARAEDLLYRAGAERMLIRRESFLRRLFFHVSLNRYAAWMGDEVRYFSKHPVERFRGDVPVQGLAAVTRLESAGVRVNEVAVYRDETRPDPIIAVRVGNVWYGVFSWE